MATSTATSTATMLGRQLDYWWAAHRRTWKGSAFRAFLQPWLYVGAMGVLLGGYIDDGGAGAGSGVGPAPTYLDFIAPGLLAATAMQTAVSEVTWPVMGAIKWDRFYLAMMATPLRVRDIVAGHLLFALFRVGLASAAFVLVLGGLGLFGSPLGLLAALGAALLTGAAFTTPVYGFSAGADSEQAFAMIYRLGVVPMFLFSGAFFPVENLAAPLEWLARLTPLWHGVEMCRMASLDTWAPLAVVHVAYLAVLAAAGAWWSVRRLTGRLVV